MRKRALCALLALCLMMALLPVTVGAENIVLVSNQDELRAAVLNDGEVCLTANISIDSVLVIGSGKTVVLDLNGHTLSSTETDEVLLEVSGGATLTIKDSGTGGTIDGLNRNSGIDVSGGTLILNSGTIANCKEMGGDGGAVDVSSSGQFIMNGGLIRDCSADDDGGAVDLGDGCTFTMNGGTIRNCSAGHEGGAVIIKKNGAKFSMNGGARIENCQAARGGGVYIEKGGIFHAEGGIIVGCTATEVGDTLYAESSGTTSGVHTVTFDSNGGSTVPQQVCVNAPAAKPADPVRYGYTFAGWYNGGAVYDFSQTVTTDLTLVAHWTPIPLTPAAEEPSTPWWFLLPALEQSAELPFYDVDSNDWFYEPVRSAWEADLIDGVTARYYMPENTLTVAQAVKLAAALHQKQSVGFVTLQNGGMHWYDNYVNYAVTNGLIEAAYQSKSAEGMNAPVTRAEFVHILSKLLRTGAVNTVNSIPDVKAGDAYADEIFAFYRAGILTGSDRLGTFHPESSLKRSEAAAILVRLYDASQRQYITLR